MRFELMKIIYLTRLKLAALNHSANSLLNINIIVTNIIVTNVIWQVIPQRIELRTHPYQKYALPIKLRNLMNIELPYI